LPAGGTLKPWTALGPLYEDLSDRVPGVLCQIGRDGEATVESRQRQGCCTPGRQLPQLSGRRGLPAAARELGRSTHGGLFDFD
jgi:hypothetical protein